MKLSDTGVLVFGGQSYTAEQMNDRSIALLEAAKYLLLNKHRLAGAQDLADRLSAEASEWLVRVRRCTDALTPGQRRTYINLLEYLKNNGCSPTFVELAAMEGLSSTTVRRKVQVLIKNGFVRQIPNARGGLSVHDSPRACEVEHKMD
jgi:hypothetical protein